MSAQVTRSTQRRSGRRSPWWLSVLGQRRRSCGAAQGFRPQLKFYGGNVEERSHTLAAALLGLLGGEAAQPVALGDSASTPTFCLEVRP